MKSEFNIMTVTAGKDKNKKGSGYNEILLLMKGAMEFSDDLDECAKVQVNREYTEKMEKFQACLEAFYRDLSEMASQGIRAQRSVAKEVTKEPQMVEGLGRLGLE